MVRGYHPHTVLGKSRPRPSQREETESQGQRQKGEVESAGWGLRGGSEGGGHAKAEGECPKANLREQPSS